MTSSDSTPRPVVLCILDGWGHRDAVEDNAIAQAHTPTWDGLLRDWPHALIDTHGAAVGLPTGQMGNSEVGHTNLGAGRVVLQDLPRISRAMEDGSLVEQPAFTRLIERLAETGGAFHLMGLMSPGGVHSHQDHMAALARAVAARNIPVWVHAFLDGRDTPPQSARDYLKTFQDAVADQPGVRIGTVSIGRRGDIHFSLPSWPSARPSKGKSEVKPELGCTCSTRSPGRPMATGK